MRRAEQASAIQVLEGKSATGLWLSAVHSTLATDIRRPSLDGGPTRQPERAANESIPQNHCILSASTLDAQLHANCRFAQLSLSDSSPSAASLIHSLGNWKNFLARQPLSGQIFLSESIFPNLNLPSPTSILFEAPTSFAPTLLSWQYRYLNDIYLLVKEFLRFLARRKIMPDNKPWLDQKLK